MNLLAFKNVGYASLWLIISLNTTDCYCQSASESNSYSSEQASSAVKNLSAGNITEETIFQLHQLCEQAVLHQDTDTLLQVSRIKRPRIREIALDKISELPVASQKRAVALILKDDEFWNYDPVHDEPIRQYSMGEKAMLYVARDMVSRLLGRDLRSTSKYYDIDPKKQFREEEMHPRTPVLNATVRRQLANELLQ